LVLTFDNGTTQSDHDIKEEKEKEYRGFEGLHLESFVSFNLKMNGADYF